MDTQFNTPQKAFSHSFSFRMQLCTIPDDFDAVSLHWHSQMEVILVRSGSGTITVSNREISICQGSLLPIMPGEMHAIARTSCNPLVYEDFLFSLEFLDASDPDDWCRTHVLQRLVNHELFLPRPILQTSPMHQELAYFLHKANEACTAREGGYSMQIKAYLLLFLQCLYAHRIKAAAPSESGHEDIVRNTISFVKANYRHSISIDEAAAAAGFSRNHFMRVFHQETGETFITYLNRYRLEVAANLLRSTNSSVNDIAVESGFDNFSYFIRLFKKQYHTSPGRYRHSIFR